MGVRCLRIIGREGGGWMGVRCLLRIIGREGGGWMTVRCLLRIIGREGGGLGGSEVLVEDYW